MATSGTWLINPATGDYVMQGGAPVIDDTLQTPAYFRTKIARTQWMYAPDPDYGSDIYLAKKKALSNSPASVAAAATRCLQPMVQDGRARSASAVVTGSTRGAVAIQENIIDASGQPQQVTFDPIGV